MGLGLMVAWSRDEPGRVGEMCYLSADDQQVYVLGRGDAPPEKPQHARARLVRQRPGATDVTVPLAGTRLSRDQLRIERVDGRAIAIENIGRRAVRVRERETRHVVAHAGDVIVIEGLFVLYCVERPPVLPSTRHLGPDDLPAFGAPDRWGLVGESPAMWELRDALAFATREPGHVLLHGPIGSGKSLVARGLGAGPLELDAATTAPTELRARALELVGDRGALGIAGLEHVSDVGADQLGRVIDELAHRGVRVVGMSAAVPESLRLAARSRFTHVVTLPSLAARTADLPLLLQAVARNALALQREPGARFRDESGAPRIGPGLVEALLLTPPDTGAHGLEAALWRAMRDSTGDWIEASRDKLDGLVKPLVQREPVPLERPAPDDEPLEDDDGEPLDVLAESDVPASVLQGISNLTRAERIVLQHVALGRTSRQIARALFVSVRTVQNHRAHICDKLGLQGHNRLLGVAMALKRVLGPPPSG